MLLDNVGKGVRHPAEMSRPAHDERARIREGRRRTRDRETGHERRRENQSQSLAIGGRLHVAKRRIVRVFPRMKNRNVALPPSGASPFDRIVGSSLQKVLKILVKFLRKFENERYPLWRKGEQKIGVSSGNHAQRIAALQ